MNHSPSTPKTRKSNSRAKLLPASNRQRTVLTGVLTLISSITLQAPEACAAAESDTSAADASGNTDLQAENERLRRQVESLMREIDRLKQNSADAQTPDDEPVSEPPPSATAAAPGADKSEGEGIKLISDKDFTPEQPSALGEVVVQARRKEEKLQDVPIPIAVIGGEQLRRDNIVSVQDFSRRVPNLGVTSANVRQTSIALRGLGKNSGNESMEASVGVQVDNVWSSWVGSTWTNFTDIDHVEVLRGPQGTLQGKNSNLGLINVVTKLPSFTPSYYVDGFAGNRDSLQGKFSATGPILDDLLAYRASFFIDQRDGFIANLDTPNTAGKLQETNAMGGRVQLLFTPTETLSARIIADRTSSKQTMSVNPNIEDPVAFADGTLRTTSYSSRLARSWFDSLRNTGQPITVIGNPRAVARDNHQVSRGDQQGISGEINWDVLGHRFTSISAYRYSLFEPHHDGDNSTADIQHISGWRVKNRQWSQEFRLSSTEPGPVDYQVGLFAMRSSAEVENERLFGADAGAFYASNAIYNALSTTSLGREVMMRSLNRVFQTGYRNPEVTSLAAFGQINWHITDAATLTLGLRNTWEHRDNRGFDGFKGGENLNDLALIGANATQIAQANAIRRAAIGNVWSAPRQGFDQNSQNWLFNPSYKFNRDLMVYFSMAGGQKSGAAQFSNTGKVENVDPEDIMDYELGIKSAWFDRKLSLNLNLYNTDVEGFQSQLTVPDNSTASGFRTTLGNIKGILLRGVELESAWQASENLSFFLNGSYNYAIYTDFKNAPCPAETNRPQCDQTGKRIPNAPEFTVNYGFDYRAPFGFGLWSDYGLQWHAYLVDSYKSKANYNASLSSSGIQPGYHVTDGGIGIGTKNGQYSLDLVGRNIFDTIYVTNVSDFSGTSAVSATYGEGRYYGVHFRANY
jgi:iron complex outermembrane receptor protein